MTVNKCLRYVNNEIRFCNLLNQDNNNKKQKYFLLKVLQEKQEKEKGHKICPNCFLEMSLTNTCDCCGYKI